MSYESVILIGLVELVILVILIVWYLGHASWMVAVQPRRDRRYQLARKALSSFIARGGQRMEKDQFDLIAGLTRGQQLSLFIQVASILSVSDRRYANRVAERLGLVSWAEELSHSRRWWRRLTAVRFLAAMGEGSEMTPNRFLHDSRVEVRAQAAEWAGDLANPRWIPDLLELLGDPDGLSRYTVQDALQRIGEPVVEPLITYLRSSRSGTELMNALIVAEEVADGRLLQPALDLSHSESARIRKLAARTLIAIGGDKALRRLLELSSDPDDHVRTEAVGGIAEVGGITHAGEIAKHLSDPAWNVRRRAGLALRRMEAPGRLLLRNATRSEDRYARDMATLVLELPGPKEAS